MQHRIISSIAVMLFVSSQALAGGFEKVTTWSAEYSALGGAAAANVEGADSVYYNPAGLTHGKDGFNVHFSPTFGAFEGPIGSSDGSTETSERLLSPLFGLTYKHTLSDKWSLGAGLYVSAGTASRYEDVDPSAFTSIEDTVESRLQAVELGLAGAYKIDDRWSVGATWRATFVEATIRTPVALSGTASGLLFANLENLQDNNFTGLRLGTQYRGDSWGLGLSLRSSVEFTAKGRLTGQYQTLTPVATTGAFTQVSAPEVESELPLQASLGSYFDLSDAWRLFVEATWTDYSAVETIEINGSGNLLGSEVELTDIAAGWSDQLNIKIGAQDKISDDMTLRFGYALTSQVVPNELARATFSSPGIGHTLAAGLGHNFGDLTFNWAVEYSFASGDVSTEEAAASSSTYEGEYSSNAYAAHLSANWAF